MFLEQVKLDSTLQYGNIPTYMEFNDTSTVIHRLQFVNSYLLVVLVAACARNKFAHVKFVLFLHFQIV